MRLLRALLGLALAAGCAAPSRDLSRERRLVEEARVSADAQDLAAARTQAGEAIAALLARGADAGDPAWLELVASAGRVASEAQDPKSARAAWEVVLEQRTKSLPDDHPDLQEAREELGMALERLGDFQGARALLEKVVDVRTRTLDSDDPDLQRARLDLAVAIRGLGERDEAAALAESVLEIDERTLPADHPELQRARLIVGNGRLDAGDPAGARELYEQVLDVRSRTLPDEHPDLQSVRLNFALTLFDLGDLEGARALQERVLEIELRTLPDDHEDLQLARAHLALTIGALGDQRGALALEERVLEVRSRTLPDDHPRLRAAHLKVAARKKKLGDFQGARELFEKVVEVDARTFPEEHPRLIQSRLLLATVMNDQGDFHGARALLERIYEVLSRTAPDDDEQLQATRRNLGANLSALGDPHGALALFEKTLEIDSRRLADDDPELQADRWNVAVTLKSLGDYSNARVLQEKVLEVLSRTLHADDTDLQVARLNLAMTLQLLGDAVAARALEERALEVLARTLPPEHYLVQSARGDLGNALLMLGEFGLAREQFETILEVQARAQAEDDITVQDARGNIVFAISGVRAIAMVHSGPEGPPEIPGERERYLEMTRLFVRSYIRFARETVVTSTGREVEERSLSLHASLGHALSFAAGMGVYEADEASERDAFVLSEESRAAVLASARLVRRANADPDAGRWREEIRAASEELARLAQGGAGADAIDAARGRRERAERQLMSLARGRPGEGGGLVEFDPRALAASITDRDAFVGYRLYRRTICEPGGPFEPPEVEHLCAFVLRSGDRLERIELGPAKAIQEAVEAARLEIGAGGGRGIGAPPAESAGEPHERSAGAALRRKIFDPLLPALDGVDRLVVALDDVLHLVPIDALPLDEPAEGAVALLGDRWRIEIRCALAELAWGEAPPRTDGSLVVLGDAAFGSLPFAAPDESSSIASESEGGSADVLALLRGGPWQAGFEPLTATGPEARGIADLYGRAFAGSAPARLLEKERASRASLVELAPAARFLHVATHGWFVVESVRSLADPEPLDRKLGVGTRMSTEDRIRGMSPMLLCGIALAGANLPEAEQGRARGLLTAEELSTLDLTGCELAVLSACDTNVGERTAGQGVASLQKALHMAGARSVITSLWKVPDEATRELMLEFYRRTWLEKEPKSRALWAAKRMLRDRGAPTRDWAAWVLTGDPD